MRTQCFYSTVHKDICASHKGAPFDEWLALLPNALSADPGRGVSQLANSNNLTTLSAAASKIRELSTFSPFETHDTMCEYFSPLVLT